MLDTITGTSRNSYEYYENTHKNETYNIILMRNIFPFIFHNFEHSRVIMNMKLSRHGFLFHRNINRRENKGKISLIIHHNEKKQRIYF